MHILLTGFEPFDGSPVNPSQRAVEVLQRLGSPGVELHTAVLPVDCSQAPALLLAAVARYEPDAVLCLGEARGRAVLMIERIAVNLLDYRIADNAGHQPTDEPVVAGGPAAYFVTAPVRRMLARLRQAGVPADLSLSAGSYLCNQVLYVLLHHAATDGAQMMGGFIHVPSLPEQMAVRPSPAASMALETIVAGVQAAVGALTDTGGRRG